MSESLRVDDLLRFELPWSFTDSLLVANLLTYGTMAVELSLAVLLWSRRARPYVVALGVALHLFIELTMSLGFFSVVMILGYLAFTPEEASARFTERVRGRLLDARWAWLRALAATGAPATAGVSR